MERMAGEMQNESRQSSQVSPRMRVDWTLGLWRRKERLKKKKRCADAWPASQPRGQREWAAIPSKALLVEIASVTSRRALVLLPKLIDKENGERE